MSVFQKDVKQVYLFQETEAQEASRNVSPFPLSTLSFFFYIKYQPFWSLYTTGV